MQKGESEGLALPGQVLNVQVDRCPSASAEQDTSQEQTVRCSIYQESSCHTDSYWKQKNKTFHDKLIAKYLGTNIMLPINCIGNSVLEAFKYWTTPTPSETTKLLKPKFEERPGMMR